MERASPGTLGVHEGMGIQDRKNHLISVLKVKKLAYRMTDEQVAGFELMYRRARTEAEQDQVSVAVEAFVNGWKTDTDAFSRLLRDVNDFGEDAPIGEDDDPPSMKAVLAQSRVTFPR